MAFNNAGIQAPPSDAADKPADILDRVNGGEGAEQQRRSGQDGRLWPVPHVPILFQPHGWSWLAVDGVLRRACVAWERIAARRTALLICVGEGEAEQGRVTRVPPPGVRGAAPGARRA